MPDFAMLASVALPVFWLSRADININRGGLAGAAVRVSFFDLGR